MNSVPSFIYALLIIVNNLVCGIHTQENVKNILVIVLKSNCTTTGDHSCKDIYLQICYGYNPLCYDRLPSNCILPPDFNTDRTDLTAVTGSNFTYTNLLELATFNNIQVGITLTPRTLRSPLQTSCEKKRENTTNGFRVVTSSADGSYQFELLIEAICYNPNCFGHRCETCATVGTTQPVQSITLNKLRTTTTTTTTITTQSLSYSSKETMKGESCNDSPFVNCDKQTVCFVPTLKLLCPRTCGLCGNTCKDNSAVNCNDINVCSIAHLRGHCPLRCGLCSPPACVDSTVIHCENPGVCSIASLVQFCPLTCGGCVPPTKMPCRDGTLVNCKTEGICINSVLKVHCDFTCGLCDKTSSTDTTYIGTTKKLGLSQIIGR